ncbi:hypothetical protein BDY21DRAFT_269409, partial [Lineolata rhizophorae]
MEPQTPRRHRPNLTRDQRLQCLTLRSIGWTYEAIARHLNISQHQVQWACHTDHPTPRKRRGRPPVLSEAQVDQLEAFIRASRTNRLMSCLELAAGPFRHWNVSEYAIRNALQR